MATILITGGTGLIGKSLTAMLLAKGHDVIIVSRSVQQGKQTGVRYAQWNIAQQTIDAWAIAEADCIMHLAGAGVADKRWTSARKKEIVSSRVESSRLLVKALQSHPNKVTSFISASAIGWYGDDKQRGGRPAFIESMPAFSDFLGDTCRQWEESVQPVEQLGIRLVKLRTGIVFSNEGGAFAEFMKPVKWGLATVLGSGQQVISWIHVEDLCRMYLFAMDKESVQGSYNAVAPHPVQNKALMLLLAKKVKGSFYVAAHVPAFVLKVMLGEMSIEVLKSATVSCNKIRETGFSFLYPSVESAVGNLLGKS